MVTNSEFRFIVTEQLAGAGQDPGAVLIEPDGRNTAPAVLAAALWLSQHDPEALMLVAPSDHVAPDGEAFRAAIAQGIDAALHGKLVTFGVGPTRAETGYGYLELAKAHDPGSSKAVDLVRFVDKPGAAAATEMLASGRHLRNAGVFLFSARTLCEAIQGHAPELLAPVGRAVSGARADLRFLRLDPEAWADVPDISLDFAMMERATSLAVVPFSGSWSDLGDWDSVWRESAPDGNGVATSGRATALDCSNTLLRSEDDGLEIVGIGLENTLAVAMPDAVLIAHKDRAQDVKAEVAALRAKGARQAEAFPRAYRPWGWFESLVTGDRFQVKRIVVHPGAALSLQSHHHRAEHWIVVEGTAKVTLGDSETLVSENQSIYIPLGTRHRLENPGKLPIVLIEVQTGAYLGEDDIVRFADAYARD